MSQFLGFGSGKDGAAPNAGVYNGEKQSGSGSSGSKTLTCGGTFTPGDIIYIEQVRGTGAGNWELNQVVSDNGATLTLLIPLVNTYTDSGDSQAQVVEMKEYNGGDISGVLTGSAWDGNVGGVVPILCSGKLIVSNDLNVDALGFRGGAGATDVGAADNGWTGEGTVGPSVDGQQAANGSGGGAGTSGGANSGSGAGGGHAAAGANGAGTNPGTGGVSSGSAALTTMTPGGGGGGGAGGNNSDGGAGGKGGGKIIIFANEIEVTGVITAAAGIGKNSTVGAYGSGGGGGAGGSILIKARKAVLGTNKISAAGAVGGTGQAANGGTGSIGRVRVEACEITGSTNNPVASEDEGGQDYCSILGHTF